MPDKITAEDLLINQDIITCSPENTLSQALAKLSSSHDAVFVVDDKNELLGVISPYHVLFQANFPSATKVENCLFSPPKLGLETPIWEIAKQMVQSKVYFLPVMSAKDDWLGIVSVRSLMKAVIDSPEILDRVEIESRRKLITIKQDARLFEARALLTSKGVSRLPVVNQSGILVGILTRYDLREALAAPKSSQRFLSRKGDKKKQLNKPISTVYKKQVFTASNKTPLKQRISQMLEKRIGSVVITNNKRQPVDIFSYRDILEAVSELEFVDQESYSISLPKDFEGESKVLDIVSKFYDKYQKRKKVLKLELDIKANRNAAGEIKLYEVSLRTDHPKHGALIGKAKDHKWKDALRAAIKKLETRLRKN